ncbi:MAG: hypothetical protein ACI9FN_002882 [Saprospiraceae bacterium]|jgi:hypothetical protein
MHPKIESMETILIENGRLFEGIQNPSLIANVLV